MELLNKKRKGSGTQISTSDIPSSLSIIDSPEEDCSKRKKKKFKEQVAAEAVNSSKSSSSSSSNSISDPHRRGHKRKIGCCIDTATQLERKKKKKIEEEFVLGSVIGQGKFGSVRLCRNKESGVEFACKTLLKGKDSIHKEVEIMQHLSGYHPSVVMLKAVYEDSDCFHLVMELCSGGSLRDQMVRDDGRYSEYQVANILKELILGIKYCHEMGVVHRDIKPENILFTDSGKMKIADFGLALRFSNGQKLSGVSGTAAYLAPDVLLGDYSNKVDIWSTGVLLHALLVGTLPFHGEANEAIFEAIKKLKLDFHSGIWQSISGPARDLISRMLTRDVSARITADEVLRHPWILFHTERTLKTVKIKSKVRKHVHAAAQSREHIGTLAAAADYSGLVLPSNGMVRSKEEQDISCIVDALAVAISRVKISEPKRSKLWGPISPIQVHEYSSNMMKANSNLCIAF